MLLGNLLKSVGKDYKKKITGISFDSRKVKKGDLFFAIKGNRISGNKFINHAITKGAIAIVCNTKTKLKNKKIPLILVKDVRKSLSEACSNFYKKPHQNIIAVTGTNGKSSVVNFFYQILNYNKVPVASIGTLGLFSKKYRSKTKLTTMDPLSLHKNLQVLANRKIRNVILEASSHGLDQKRLDNLNINIGIFTNFSHDHLDYHKNMKSYFDSKMYLFNNLLKKNSKIISDEDINEIKTIKSIAKKREIKKLTIGTKFGDLKILQVKHKQSWQFVKVYTNSKVYNLKIPLIGHFQLKNLFMAALAAFACGIGWNKIFKQIHKIKSVPGRLECVTNLNNSSYIIVDFAHTPDALQKTLIALKKQFNKKILIVFGCGGERDRKKRYSMGKIASKYCRKIFVTDDNPRNENPQKIRNAILKGCTKPSISIGNRKKAIEHAIDELSLNEILLVAGKGHEETQNFGNKIINFSDKKLIKKIINKKMIYFKKQYYNNFLLGKIYGNNVDNIKYSGVSINSKNIKKNNLFFAIKGKKIDGHKFVKEASRKGATKIIVSKKINGISSNKVVKVRNTLSSLRNLAINTRNSTSSEIIGITGSVGKTTLKNLISFALKNYGKVYHSPHSYNNKFGVPLSLSNLKNNINYGVFEIGMDKKGEIDNLSKIVKPELAIITNISSAHIKNFNSLKDIAKAKAEIIPNIIKGGYIILNKDDKFFGFLSNQAKKKGIKVISFSCKKKSDIFLINIKKNKNIFKLKIKVKNKIFYFNVQQATNSFINNILACISSLYVLNLNLDKMKKKFTKFIIPEGRGNIKVVKKFKKRFKFIDESYNANPLSMISAIKNMNYYNINKKCKKLVFLGDMLELGKKSKKLHRDLSVAINESKIDKVFVIGKHINETFNYLSTNKKGKVFKNLEEAAHHFRNILHNGDLLMVKGSNATGLNEFSKSFIKG